MLKRFVASTKMFPFHDYDLDLVDGRDELKLIMRYREQTALMAA
jgi:hypothetical protein